MMIATLNIFKTPNVPTGRRRSDQIIRYQMLWAALGAVAINILAFHMVFTFDLAGPLLDILEEYEHIEDKAAITLVTALITTIFILILYSLKVRNLLQDIQRLAQEREKDRKALIQRQKLEALGHVAAGISHEINGSLQAILGSCEMARNRLKENTEAYSFIQRAIDNSLHARRVISNVLTFSSSSAAHKTENLNLNKALPESINYAAAYLAPTVTIKQSDIPQDYVIHIDRVSFIQIMSNLINNSAQAMNQHGSITISVKKSTLNEESTSPISAKPGNYISITVSDTGKGISEDNISKIFDPFYTTKNIGEGTGLGLSIVHGLIKSMNGYIDISSQLGIGTDITIYFPQIEGTQHAN